MPGFIKLHRELIKKPIWLNSTPEQKSILIAILLSVNFVEKEWEWNGEKYKVLAGQMITSLESIKRKCGKGISIQNIRTSLKRFEKLEFLTNEPTKTGRLIIVINWDAYQINQDEHNIDANKDLTKTQQRPNKDLTSKKKVKKEEKEKNLKNLPQKKDFAEHSEPEPEFYLTRKKRKLTGKRLETFNLFWESFGYKKDRANAADSWLDIPALNNGLVNKIIEAAKAERINRADLVQEGRTPIFPQGWLSGKRWEDEHVKPHEETDAEYAERMGLK